MTHQNNIGYLHLEMGIIKFMVTRDSTVQTIPGAFHMLCEPLPCPQALVLFTVGGKVVLGIGMGLDLARGWG